MATSITLGNSKETLMITEIIETVFTIALLSILIPFSAMATYTIIKGTAEDIKNPKRTKY